LNASLCSSVPSVVNLGFCAICSRDSILNLPRRQIETGNSLSPSRWRTRNSRSCGASAGQTPWRSWHIPAHRPLSRFRLQLVCREFCRGTKSRICVVCHRRNVRGHHLLRSPSLGLRRRNHGVERYSRRWFARRRFPNAVLQVLYLVTRRRNLIPIPCAFCVVRRVLF
jgi:hypothetical protein